MSLPGQGKGPDLTSALATVVSSSSSSVDLSASTADSKTGRSNRYRRPFPATDDVERHEFQRQCSVRGVSRRDIADAVLITITLRNSLAGNPTELSTPAIQATIIDHIACRGFDPDEARAKLAQLMAFQHQVMDWRKVKPMTLSCALASP